MEEMEGEWTWIDEEDERKNFFKTFQRILTNLFKVTYSDKAKMWLWWMSIIGVFMQDLGQLIVQILYKQNTIVYNIIPLLTLITSSAIVTISLIGWIWHTVKYINKRRKRQYSISDEEMSINS
ncbi:7728_t:CDS:2 [Cetraspora pellucida]|uniref:7728_t:CDS:1 n=1 Tax=Cetraspora pellucida TaxID=1433469 RepID=A0ACA9KMY1_9GLOM|nr:7728_t:CDS:2 [Cetraspora pellucida]